MITRRDVLLAALAAPAFGVTRERLASSRSSAPAGVRVDRRWQGDLCKLSVTNTSRAKISVPEVVVFNFEHGLPPDTRLYGESFQMLSQTAGTLARPVDLAYAERKHYRLPQPEDATALSGMMTLSPKPGDHRLLAFTSCKRFIGRFYVRPSSIQAVVDTEGLTLAPGERWDLEEFLFAADANRAKLLERLANRINRNHPRLTFAQPPAGWCSWYCFGPRVTAEQVLANLDVIAKQAPGLKYVQIDDGYQPAMGDWLDTGQAFGGNVQSVLKEIRKRGFEPAIWVGPFIAEAQSRVFREHPDWFIRNEKGAPLQSDLVTFGGWRRKPWFALDGTHPEARKHLENVFRTMRQEWGCTYFKLDANFWGAMHGGHFYDPKATRIEAYRRGMQAIARGAGDSFLLGCNHPIWPSFGLIHGSRSSGDVSRRWTTMRKIARENLSRNWQNAKLWWNDPDCVLLSGNLTEDEFRFHATAVYASGGLILSGDDLTKLTAERMAWLKKLLPPTGVAAEFADDTFRVGYIPLKGRTDVCVFNETDEPLRINVPLQRPGDVTDFWTGENMGTHRTAIALEVLPPHSARLFQVKE